MKLRRTLLNISQEIEDRGFEYINSGGCCWFAAHLARALEKRKIPFRIVFDGPSNSTECLEDQANENNSGCSARHVYIKLLGVENSYYDSDGFQGEPYQSSVVFEWSSEQTMNFHKAGSWNDTFKYYRSKHDRREIINIIKKEFKRYDSTDSTGH